MRRGHRARSRKTLLCGVVVFVALQWGLSLIVALAWPDLRDPLYYGKERWLRGRTVGVEPKPLTVVLLGTSRSDRGFFAQPLEEEIGQVTGRPTVIYNFGIDGAGALTRLIFLRRLLAEGIRPDLLLVEVLPPTLNNLEPYTEIPQLKGRRLRANEIDLVLRHGGSSESLRSSWMQSWLAPWYEHRFMILCKISPAFVQPNRFQATLKNVNAWGWQDYPRAPMTLQERADAHQWTHEFWTKRWLRLPFLIEGQQMEAYRELLATCRQEGIPTRLVWMPEGPRFRSWYPTGVMEQIQKTLAGWSTDYGVSMIDAHEWINEEELFVDSHHLLPDGARRFSERLGHEVLRPWAMAQAQQDRTQAMSAP